MMLKNLVMRGLIECYLFFRSFGIAFYSVSWLIIRRMVGFLRRYGFRRKPRAVHKRQSRNSASVYTKRSHQYDIKTALIIKRMSRWFN